MMGNYIWNLTDLKDVPKNGRKVFTTFSCGGGSSMGYKLAGYEVIGNCEIDPQINAMYVKNHHPKYNFLMGVQDFYKEENRKNIPDELYNIDVLDGSPPCSTFSISGDREKNWGKEKHFREGQAKQILDNLFFEFLNVAELLKPKVIVAENVKGMLAGNAKGYLRLVFDRLDELGYDAQLFLLNAATMGVPQKRERVFFVAGRKEFHFPKIKMEFNEKPILYGEFASDDYIPFKKDSLIYQRWCKRAPSDVDMSDTVRRMSKGARQHTMFNYTYYKPDKVPVTQTAKRNGVRYDAPGYISTHDVKCIQSFPQDYDFNGNSVEYVCGMSVPPLMMKGVATEVYKQWLSKLE